MGTIVTYDVIVIGAGISGLTATYTLKKKIPSLSVLLLEAKDRIGGRTQTVSLKTGKGEDRFDLGGQWVGGCQIHIMKLLKELGLKTYKQYNTGKNVLQTGGKVKPYTGNIFSMSLPALINFGYCWIRTEYLRKQIDIHNPCSHPKAAEWDNISVAGFYENLAFTQEAKDSLYAFIRALFGFEASQASFLYYLYYIQEAGGLKKLTEDSEDTAQEAKIAGGVDTLHNALVSVIGKENIKVNEPVLSISQNESGVTVVTKSGMECFTKHIILAMPPKATETIQFNPPLSRDRQFLSKKMQIGCYYKVLVTYKEPFWKMNGRTGMYFCLGPPFTSKGLQQPLTFGYDGSSVNNSPAIIGFICGTLAVEWALESAEDRKAAVLKQLSDLFGNEALSPVDYIEKDWSAEPYTFGAPVCALPPGCMEHFANSIRRIEGRIHFAGTEAAMVWTGYISGAVESGQRAAFEILDTIAPDTLNEEEKERVEAAKQETTTLVHRKMNRQPTYYGLSLMSIIFLLSCVIVLVAVVMTIWTDYLN